MIRKLQIRSFPFIGVIICAILIFCFCANPLLAQNVQKKDNQLKPLHSGVKLYEFTGSLRWHTFYVSAANYFKKRSQTELQVQFRNIYLLGTHIGVGYKFLSTFYMSGLFKRVSGGVGGIGGGPIIRVYPLKGGRWQPYLQSSFMAGYDLALSDISGIERYNGLRYRIGLRAGLDYRFTNTFGIFFEIGPEWEYTNGLNLDAHALQINIGIKLFRF